MMLAEKVQRPVVDRTGLSGPFRLALTLNGGPVAIFAAVREQLGMTLAESQTVAKVMVIDHIERPSRTDQHSSISWPATGPSLP